MIAKPYFTPLSFGIDKLLLSWGLSLLLIFALVGQAAAQTIFVAHNTPNLGESVISALDKDGNLLSQFGLINTGSIIPEFRAHLAQADGFFYRSNGTVLSTISRFDANGNPLGDIVVDSSASHTVNAIAADFADQSIFFTDIHAGTNVVRHLDDPSTGVSSSFALISYSGVAGVIDLYFGGPAGSQALYALNHTAPFAGGIARVARIDAGGSVTFLDNPEFDTPFVLDIGALAVDPRNGDVVVATSTKVVRVDAAGTALGSFSLVDTKPSLDIDSDGTLYVGLFNTGEVHVLDENGTSLKVLQVPGATRVFDVRVLPTTTTDTDLDGDGVPDDEDNCPADPNPMQDDLDLDEIGDVCDLDDDGDATADLDDNCPIDFNPGQADADFDGLGDACDSTYNTGTVVDAVEENANDVITQVLIANPPGGNGMIAKLTGNGGVVKKVASAVAARDAGLLDTATYINQLNSALEQLTAFDNLLAAKISKGQIVEPEASNLHALSAQIRGTINTLIANA